MLYHIRSRRIVIDSKIDTLLKDMCIQIALRYDMDLVEIGTDKDHVHFLVQSVPTMSGTGTCHYYQKHHGKRDILTASTPQERYVGK
jgi:REP element-mobilizing transposase RayT